VANLVLPGSENALTSVVTSETDINKNDKLFGLCLSINLLFYIGNILVANQGLEPRTCGL